MIQILNADLRKQYHKMNGLEIAFVLKEGNRKWGLYFGPAGAEYWGRPDYLHGWHEGTYKTRKAALEDAERHHPELRRVIISA